MARNVSQAMEEAARGSRTKRVIAELVRITHADLAAPLRLTNNNEPVTLGGEEFAPYRFEVQLADDEDGSAYEGRLSLSSVALDRALVNAVRTANAGGGAIEVEIWAVDCTNPQAPQVERHDLPFTWRGLEWGTLQLSGTLRLDETFLEESAPGLFFTPGDGFPQATTS